jgi:hypothetical protein
MALPFLKTWQPLADFKYPECAVGYQPPIINVSDLSGTPPQLLKIYYPINFRNKEILLAMSSAASDNF